MLQLSCYLNIRMFLMRTASGSIMDIMASDWYKHMCHCHRSPGNTWRTCVLPGTHLASFLNMELQLRSRTPLMNSVKTTREGSQFWPRPPRTSGFQLSWGSNFSINMTDTIRKLRESNFPHVCKYSHWTSVLSDMWAVFKDISSYILLKRVEPPPLLSSTPLSDEESLT